VTKHLFRLVWNRKRQNVLVIVEIFFSFVVLFAVTAAALWALDGMRRPLGFEIPRVLNVSIRTRQTGDIKPDSSFWPLLENALRRTRALPEVEAAAAVMSPPYSNSTWESDSARNGRRFSYQENFGSDELTSVLGLDVTSGRWFSREDDADTGWEPVVINERLRRELFGSADPLGQQIADPPKERVEGDEPWVPRRVVGVIADFRKDGEIAPLGNYVFNRVVPRPGNSAPKNIVVKVREGTPVAFEDALARALQQVDPGWSVVVNPLAESRSSRLRRRLAPLVLLGLVGLFLLLMVVLGLTGVVWQNVTRRTREIGLRRAKGSTAGQVVLLIVGEVLVLTAFGVVPALVLLLQIPLLGALPGIGTGVYLSSLAVSIAAMFVLTALCALAPARTTLRLSPAEALRDE
jgi:putative ABC transport system permease protein